MSGVNQFQTFAEGGSANTLTPAAYAALTTLLANGYQTGVASSQQINTTLRQAAFASAALAGIISDAGYDALDDGNLANFKARLLAAMSIPAGSMIDFAGSAAPNGFLLCNGAAISRTAYASLFAVIGTTFGAGDGSTTFNIPDARNRARVGSGSLYAIGGTGGSKDAVVVSHTHTENVAGPAGTFYASNRAGPGPTGSFYDAGGRANSSLSGGGLTGDIIQYGLDGSHTHTLNSTGISGTDNNMMPYFACPLIIKY